MNPCGKSQEAWTSFSEYNGTTVFLVWKGFCHGCQKSTVLPSAYSSHTVTRSLCSFSRIAAFQLKAGLNLKCTLSCFWMQQKRKKNHRSSFQLTASQEHPLCKALILFYNILSILNTSKKHCKSPNWFIKFSS